MPKGKPHPFEANAGELVACCLAQLERWQEARDAADGVVAFCEQSGYRNMLWRVLGWRALAHARLGAMNEAQRDYEGAAAVVSTLAQAMPNEALRAAFLEQAAANDLVAATRSTR